MADLTRSSSAVPVDVLYKKPQVRQAGVTISAGEAVYIDSNGKFQKAVSTNWLVTGTSGQIAFDGLAAKDIPSGTYGEIYGNGVEFHYSDTAMTVGLALWVSNTAGKLADARVAAAGTDQPVAVVSDANTIRLIRGVG